MLVTTVKGQQVLTPVAVQLKGIATAAQAANPPVQQLQKNLNSFGNIISKSLSNIRGTIVGLTTAFATIGTIQMFKNTIQEAIDFEAQMANVSTVLQGNAVSLQQLKDQVIGLDGSLGSSTEQAKALYNALSTGVEPANSVKFIAEAAIFAKANLADLDQAVLLLATTMNTYGDRISSVSHLTDVFSETIRAGAITGEQLVASLGTVINTAALANIEIESIAAAMATLTSVAIPAQQASTALNQAILGFISPSEKAKKVAADLKIELSLSRLQTLGLVGAMQELAKIAEKDQSLIAELFGEVRAFKAIAALTGEQMEFFADSTLKMKTGVVGLAKSMFDLSQQSLKAQLATAINNANKALDSLWQTIIQKVTPAIVKLSENFVRLVGEFKEGELDDEITDIKNAILLLVGAWAALKVPMMITQIKSLMTLIGAAQIATLFSMAKATGEWGTALSLLGGHISAVLPWLTRLGGVLTVVYTAFKLLQLNNVISELDEVNKKVEEGKEIEAGTVFMAAQKMWDEYRIFIQTTGRSTQEIIKDLQAARKQLNENSVTVTAKLDPVIKKTTDTVKGLNDELQKLRDSFNKVINPSDALAKEIDELAKAGFTETEIMRGMYDEILKVIAAEKAMGQAVHTSIAAREEAAKAIETHIKLLKELETLGSAGVAGGAELFSETNLQRMKTYHENLAAFYKQKAEWEAEDRQMQEEALEEIAEYEREQLAKRLENWSEFFGAISNAMGGFIGGLFNSISNAIGIFDELKNRAGEQDIFGHTLGLQEAKVRAFAGAVGSILSDLSQVVQGVASDILNVAGSIAQGFALGGPWGAVIAGVSSLIGILTRAKDKVKEFQKAAQSLGLTLSKDLAKALEELAKESGLDIMSTILTNLDKIAEETPITANNLITFINAFNTALSTFAAGSTLAKDVIEDLNKLLPDMLKAATNEFGHLNNEMLAFIANLQAAGVEVAALDEFMSSTFTASSNALTGLIESFGTRVTEFSTKVTDSIRKIIKEALPKELQEDALAFLDKLIEKDISLSEVIKRLQVKFPDLDLGAIFSAGGDFLKPLIETRAEFTDFFTLIMAQIGEMQAQGMSLAEIFNQLGPAILTLRDAAIELGLRNDPAFKPFFQLFKLLQSGVGQDLANLNTMFTTFNNLGILNQQTFSSLENIFQRIFKEFNKDGKISRAEMTAMLPTLAQMRSLAAQYGFELDAATQAMIDLAIERGQLPEEMPVDPMVRFADVIENKLIPAIDRFSTALENALGIVNSFPAEVTTTFNAEIGTVPSYGSQNPKFVRSFAGVVEPTVITNREEIIRVHQGEEIHPAGGSGKAQTVIVQNNFEGMRFKLHVGDREFDAYITSAINQGAISPKTSTKELQRNRY